MSLFWYSHHVYLHPVDECIRPGKSRSQGTTFFRARTCRHEANGSPPPKELHCLHSHFVAKNFSTPQFCTLIHLKTWDGEGLIWNSKCTGFGSSLGSKSGVYFRWFKLKYTQITINTHMSITLYQTASSMWQVYIMQGSILRRDPLHLTGLPCLNSLHVHVYPKFSKFKQVLNTQTNISIKIICEMVGVN